MLLHASAAQLQPDLQVQICYGGHHLILLLLDDISCTPAESCRSTAYTASACKFTMEHTVANGIQACVTKYSRVPEQYSLACKQCASRQVQMIQTIHLPYRLFCICRRDVD